jgi:hypothetical protein
MQIPYVVNMQGACVRDISSWAPPTPLPPSLSAQPPLSDCLRKIFARLSWYHLSLLVTYYAWTKSFVFLTWATVFVNFPQLSWCLLVSVVSIQLSWCLLVSVVSISYVTVNRNDAQPVLVIILTIAATAPPQLAVSLVCMRGGTLQAPPHACEVKCPWIPPWKHVIAGTTHNSPSQPPRTAHGHSNLVRACRKTYVCMYACMYVWCMYTCVYMYAYKLGLRPRLLLMILLEHIEYKPYRGCEKKDFWPTLNRTSQYVGALPVQIVTSDNKT